jgi:hypothetical protein
MKRFTYKVIQDVALASYKENGMTFEVDQELFNGVLTIEAADEETADKIRMTFTDIRMWEKVDE